jgi:hypothetical protein
VPQFFALTGSDAVENNAIVFGGVSLGGDARSNQQLLIGRGVACEIGSTARAPVHAERFRALALTTPNFTPGDAQAIWSALKSADLLDANSYLRAPVEIEDVEAALPAAYRARAAEVANELAAADATRGIYSEADARIIAFLNARIAEESGPAPGRLANLSTRTKIAFVGDTFTLGFNLAGPEKATLLIRGIGPALGRFGVDTALVAPRLEVHRGATLIAANEGWSRDASSTAAIVQAAASVGAFVLTPGEADAAVLLTLDAGSYTATLSGLNGATGDVLAEVYDVSRNRTRLTNLSALGKISGEGEMLLPALVVQGGAPRTLIARAVGPGLADVGFDFASLLGDPRLTVLNANGGTVKLNDNWSLGGGASLPAASAAVGAFPLKSNSADAALNAALAPGNYTVRVDAAPRLQTGQQSTAAPNATGAVLIEIYEVP